MNSERDTLVTLTPNQQNPGTAKATDFVIEDRDGGQCGDSPAERAKLLREAQNAPGKSRLGSPLPDRNNIVGGNRD